jgi:hypothetical protein
MIAGVAPLQNPVIQFFSFLMQSFYNTLRLKFSRSPFFFSQATNPVKIASACLAAGKMPIKHHQYRKPPG